MTKPERRNVIRKGAGGRTIQDVGGLDFGAIDRSEHDLAHWEKRVDAMMILLFAKRGVFKVDAMRRMIESYSEQEYDKTEYYEKWVRAMRNLLVETEVLSRAEIDTRIAEVAKAMRAGGRRIAKGKVPWDELDAEKAP